MTSIIIPAHNEEKVIAVTLAELLPGVILGEIEVIVICNGCSDNTAEIVASLSKNIRCIETPVPSKTNALNLGDAAATGFPRIYLDADVVLSLQAIREIFHVLNENKFLAAAPEMRMDYQKASWAVRSYYEIWRQLSYVQEGMIGTGVYALSEAGRKRFDKFPDIIADDGFIRALFFPHERTSIKTCYSLVRAPKNLNGLIKIKTRSRLGGYELALKFPELLKNEDKNYTSALAGLLSQVRFWPKVLIYLFVNMLSRYRAKKYYGQGLFSTWERDDSSREHINGIQ
jgi:glycosyltransferase involved in cell wall biosynthesis